jgi:drug/metabolite transporter (DMT)-like permease
VVTILALLAAGLYGAADFLGGAASRRATAISLLAINTPVGTVIMIAVALLAGGPRPTGGSLAWGAAGGAVGGAGLILFYAGLAAGPMSVVAPVSALTSALLPVGIALAGGERPGTAALIGCALCIAAIALVSIEPNGSRMATASAGRGGRAGWVAAAAGLRSARRALMAGLVSGLLFGLFFVCIRNAGHGGGLWPLVASRGTGMAVALAAAAWTRTRPVWWDRDRTAFWMALLSSGSDLAANVFYLLATQRGMFSLAVVLTALYPGVTVLLARIVLGERMRPVQQAGLILAAAGVVLVTAA